MRVILAIVFSFTTFLSLAQTANTYFDYSNKAEQLLNEKKYLESLGYAKESLKLDLNYGVGAFSFFSRYLENIRITDSLMKQEFENYCYLLAENGIKWKDINSFGNRIITLGDPFRADSLKSRYFIFIPSIRFKDIVDKRKYQRIYLKTRRESPKLDNSLIKRVKRIDKLDQKIRKSKKTDYSYYDSLVYVEFKGLIEESHDFPRYDEIGEEGYDIIGTCLSHMSAERLLIILPELEKGVRNGTIFIVKDIIYAIDRNAIENGKYIIYKDGKYVIVVDTVRLYKTYFYSGVSSFYFTYDRGQKYLYPINPNLNIRDINQLRYRFFMPSIEQTMKQYSLELISPVRFKACFDTKRIRLNSYL